MAKMCAVSRSKCHVSTLYLFHTPPPHPRKSVLVFSRGILACDLSASATVVVYTLCYLVMSVGKEPFVGDCGGQCLLWLCSLAHQPGCSRVGQAEGTNQRASRGHKSKNLSELPAGLLRVELWQKLSSAGSTTIPSERKNLQFKFAQNKSVSVSGSLERIKSEHKIGKFGGCQFGVTRELTPAKNEFGNIKKCKCRCK